MTTNGGMQTPGIFQGKMNKLFQVFKYTHAYIVDLLVLTTGNWTYHLTNLEQVLMKLKGKGLRFNIENSSSGQSEMEYLVLWVPHEGLRPTTKMGNLTTTVFWAKL